MEKFIITTGKTIDLAISAALEQLKLDRMSVSVEVLEQPKSGFLGFGAQPAKVKVTYGEEEEPLPAAALSSASRSKPKPYTPKVSRPAPPKPEAARPAPAKPEPPRPAPRGEKAEKRSSAAPKPAVPSKPAAPKPPAPPKVYTPAAPGSTEERIERFLKGLLEHMGSDAVPHAQQADDTLYRVELTGENLGVLIGHRGETLDAIQHLANYVVNRGSGKRVRVNVDAEDYRRKREESLERLARKVAGKVVKFRRDVILEPMNAYERHVIHAALQDYPDVATHSTGAEPNRRIVVSYARGRQS